VKKVVLLIFPILLGTLCLAKQDAEKEEAKQSFDDVIFNWSLTFAEAMQLANQRHYKIPEKPEEGMVKAIDSFLTYLDPHSGLLDPKTYKSILESTSGEFFGIGIVMDNTRQTKDKFLVVVDTIPGGPADKAGVKPLDKIIEVDGALIEGMSTDETAAKLRGERNTKVSVKVIRENSPDLLTFDIIRDVVKEQNTVCFYLPDQNMYYLGFSMFSENSVKPIEDVLKQVKKKKYRGLILDLRNNSGGLLSAAVDIAGLFLDKGSVVAITKDKHDKVIEQHVTTRKPILTKDLPPVFILINNYTASAAEILAGCLKIHSQELSRQTPEGQQQERLMVFLVGTKSFGKGSVQEVIPISNNCAVKLTISLYFLPKDTNIQGVGIEPDFPIEKRYPPTDQMNWFSKFYGRERVLTNYIKPNGEARKMMKRAG
jgi:carboxyl-terminal processing protease